MWVVAKVKIKELKIFEKNFIEKAGNDAQFYYPKIEYYKYFGNKVKKSEKFVLENYIFCYHSSFNKLVFISNLKFLRGLDYFLDGYFQSQSEIIKFIEYCKSFENKKGYLTQNFFKTIIKKRAKFISGPFKNIIFEILEKQKNRLKIVVGNIITTISHNTDYLYRPD